MLIILDRGKFKQKDEQNKGKRIFQILVSQLHLPISELNPKIFRFWNLRITYLNS